MKPYCINYNIIFVLGDNYKFYYSYDEALKYAKKNNIHKIHVFNMYNTDIFDMSEIINDIKRNKNRQYKSEYIFSTLLRSASKRIIYLSKNFDLEKEFIYYKKYIFELDYQEQTISILSESMDYDITELNDFHSERLFLPENRIFCFEENCSKILSQVMYNKNISEDYIICLCPLNDGIYIEGEGPKNAIMRARKIYNLYNKEKGFVKQMFSLDGFREIYNFEIEL